MYVMAGAELDGMESFEEMLLQAAEEGMREVNSQASESCGVEGDPETTSLALQEHNNALHIYAIDMDISETMGTLKSRAAEALHLDPLSFDPLEWTGNHIRQWLSWAVYQFGLQNVDVNNANWGLTGQELFGLSQTEFRKLVPDDPGDVFYMHFELLRRTNVVAVVCDPNSLVPKPAPPKIITATPTTKTHSIQISTVKSSGDGSSRSVSSGGGSSGVSGNSTGATGSGGPVIPHNLLVRLRWGVPPPPTRSRRQFVGSTQE
ncbi:DNA-binding protein Ets97D-like [Homarus americanus]|uniref:DNA-binding protein Ets97D-like n=1 Tax=Homarus americanus TaxID=6706 RepID=A0A8J5JFC3_HOMAM|nr:DNA-binding protein Ets97D-like [Homarus americanus]